MIQRPCARWIGSLAGTVSALRSSQVDFRRIGRVSNLLRLLCKSFRASTSDPRGPINGAALRRQTSDRMWPPAADVEPTECSARIGPRRAEDDPQRHSTRRRPDIPDRSSGQSRSHLFVVVERTNQRPRAGFARNFNSVQTYLTMKRHSG